MNAISPIRSSICLRSRGATKKGLITSTGECGTDSSAAVRKRSVGAHRSGTAARSESSSDSPLEGDGFELLVPRDTTKVFERESYRGASFGQPSGRYRVRTNRRL